MASLSPSIKFSALDANGNPAAGWKVYTYEAGTSTPKATYTTSAASVANANPVVLDSRGEATIWLSGTYKIRLTTAADVLVWEDDNVSDGTTNGTFTNASFAGTLSISSTSVTWSGNPTHSGNHTFSGNVSVNGNTTLGNASGDTLTVNPNAVTWSNNPTHSGTNTFSSLAITTGAITSGTYTPTLTNVTNVSSSTAFVCNYIRVGAIVYVSGFVTIDPTTAAGTSTELGISLPIASAFVGGAEASGVGVLANGTSMGDTGPIGPDVTNDRLALSFFANDLASRNWTFTAMYRIV
jgi:hypothetical protein